MWKDFRTFILRGNVVDLAVGIIIGVAFGTVVSSFVKNLLTPLVSIPGKVNFSDLHFTIRHSVFAYGSFLNDLISFVIRRGRGVLLRRPAVERPHGAVPAGAGRRNEALPGMPHGHPGGRKGARRAHRRRACDDVELRGVLGPVSDTTSRGPETSVVRTPAGPATPTLWRSPTGPPAMSIRTRRSVVSASTGVAHARPRPCSATNSNVRGSPRSKARAVS